MSLFEKYLSSFFLDLLSWVESKKIGKRKKKEEEVKISIIFVLIVSDKSMKTLSNGFPGLGEKVNWFPGHMHRALKLMKENVDKIDCFLEIRDSRVPISSRN